MDYLSDFLMILKSLSEHIVGFVRSLEIRFRNCLNDRCFKRKIGLLKHNINYQHHLEARFESISR